MRYILLIAMLLSTFRMQAQDTASASIITTAIDVISKLTACDDSASLKAVKANRLKARLLRRYNRWERRERITSQQYEALVSELLNVSVLEYRQMKHLYK